MLKNAIGIAAVHSGPLVEIGAAGAALAAGILSEDPQGKAAGIVRATQAEGFAWAASGFFNELNNIFGDRKYSSRPLAANVMSMLAGALGASGAYFSSSKATDINYASATAWAIGGLAAASAIPRFHDKFAKILQGGSAAINVAAAVMAELATEAAANGDTQKAAAYTVAAGALWTGASMSAEAAVVRERLVPLAANRATDAVQPTA